MIFSRILMVEKLVRNYQITYCLIGYFLGNYGKTIVLEKKIV